MRETARVTFFCLLKGLGFLPGAALAAGLLGLPYFAAFYWLSGSTVFRGFVIAAYLLTALVLVKKHGDIFFDETLHGKTGFTFFKQTLYYAALYAAVYCGFIGPVLRANLGDSASRDLLLLLLPVAAESLVWMLLYYAWERENCLRAFACEGAYPEDRGVLTYAALRGREISLRLKAIEKLPPEKERQAIEKAERALIPLCEKTLGKSRDYVYTSDGESAEILLAASALKALYNKYGIPKSIVRSEETVVVGEHVEVVDYCSYGGPDTTETVTDYGTKVTYTIVDR